MPFPSSLPLSPSPSFPFFPTTDPSLEWVVANDRAADRSSGEDERQKAAVVVAHRRWREENVPCRRGREANKCGGDGEAAREMARNGEIVDPQGQSRPFLSSVLLLLQEEEEVEGESGRFVSMRGGGIEAIGGEAWERNVEEMVCSGGGGAATRHEPCHHHRGLLLPPHPIREKRGRRAANDALGGIPLPPFIRRARWKNGAIMVFLMTFTTEWMVVVFGYVYIYMYIE